MKGLAADLALRISSSEEPSPQNNSLDLNFTKQLTDILTQASDQICNGDLFVLSVSSSTETYLQFSTPDPSTTIQAVNTSIQNYKSLASFISIYNAVLTKTLLQDL